MAAAHGVLISTNLLLAGWWGGLWSGIPLVAVILAVILSPDGRLPGTGSLSPQGSLLYLWWSLHSRPSQARPCPQGPLLSLWCVLPCFFPTDHTPPSGGQTDPSFLGRAAGTCSRGQMPLLLSELPGGLGTCHWGCPPVPALTQRSRALRISGWT